MRLFVHHTRLAAPARAAAVALSLAVLVSLPAGIGRAAQLIPSVGYTQSTDSNSESGKFYGGVALRAPLLPFLSAEGGIAYRDESFANGDLTVRMWPVTASLWLTPIPMVYAGGGIGWYRTSYDYRSSLLIEDSTTSDIGLHLGGGLAIPVAPSLGLDLNGRYIFMQDNNKVQLPTEFNPDFWSLSAGLAISF
ncbi:MAG TPA: outer membrane beta-barrel protein [Candidatus Eisenbacteria bacterium]